MYGATGAIGDGRGDERDKGYWTKNWATKAPGDTEHGVSLDGKLLSEEALLDLSALTGESMLVKRLNVEKRSWQVTW